ncbi:MAG: hypothetical protein U0269_09525 [Polyangiales bacterium]
MASSARRTALAAIVSLALSALAFGCEEAPIGARCESVNDCDRTGSGTSRGCYSKSDPNQPCSGAGQSCVCCPVLSMRNASTDHPFCRGGQVIADSGVPTDSGVVSDSGVATEAGSSADASAQDASSSD